MNGVIGLDIGGANLKASDAHGWSASRSFKLWKQPHLLAEALVELLSEHAPSRLAVTMTGELCDCYETKQDGVNRILAEVQRAFPAIPIQVWSTEGRFLSSSEACAHHMKVAASNWHALASVLGRIYPGLVLLIDVGSTTTDIIPILNGKPIAIGLTDTERLRSKELLYSGVRRTPICALLQEKVAAELFATTLDAYLILGDIAEDESNCQTADGRPATKKHAHSRLARMLGSDSHWTSEEDTRKFALLIRQIQRTNLIDAMRTVIARQSVPPQRLILAGSGEFLVQQMLRDFRLEIAPLVSLSQEWGPERSTAACAHAVAVLAEKA